MVCPSCGSTISQVSWKSGGYYCCSNARRNSCNNKIIVRRKLVEQLVLDEVRKRMSSPEQIRNLLEKVEDEISNLYSNIPESINRKESELWSENRRLRNKYWFHWWENRKSSNWRSAAGKRKKDWRIASRNWWITSNPQSSFSDTTNRVDWRMDFPIQRVAWDQHQRLSTGLTQSARPGSNTWSEIPRFWNALLPRLYFN